MLHSSGAYEKHGDVFAFGIILGELITRRVPYEEHNLNPNAILLRVADGLRPIAPGSADVPSAGTALGDLYKLAKQCWAPQSGTPCTGPEDWAPRPWFCSRTNNTSSSTGKSKAIEPDSIDVQLEKLLNRCEADESKALGTLGQKELAQKQAGCEPGGSPSRGGGAANLDSVMAFQEQSWYDKRGYVRLSTESSWKGFNAQSETRFTFSNAADVDDAFQQWLLEDARVNDGTFGAGWSFDGGSSGASGMGEESMSNVALIRGGDNSSGGGVGGGGGFRGLDPAGGEDPHPDFLDHPAPPAYLRVLYVDHMDDDSVQRLCKEMTLLRRLRHANLLPFLGASSFEDGDVWRFELAFAGAGAAATTAIAENRLQPLANVLPSRPESVDLGDLLEISDQVANGLEWLHAPGKLGGAIAHLNINWASILVCRESRSREQRNRPEKRASTSRGNKNRAALSSNKTTQSAGWCVKLSALELSVVSGSAFNEDDVYEDDLNLPAWVAPEIHLGNDGECASDVYSFGILLWCVMTRRTPFEGNPPRTIGRLVLSQKMRPQYRFDELSRLPFETRFIKLMTACWASSPQERPSIREVRRQVHMFSQDIRRAKGIALTWKTRISSGRRAGGDSKRDEGVKTVKGHTAKNGGAAAPAEIELVVYDGAE